MKFKKSIYKAEKLLDSYQHDPDITLLNAFKKQVMILEAKVIY